ncbi:Cilia- and flagella-associated protein 57 [Folsomia candida]|uniref:Cilia-and flagella-associated protein 57 n=1 Tax=Folsomia candida TaxID=158441 RepID=A0A226D9H0_FOLCA|nr:Cilia- and flagella-associated protein 57 [Folsomia candida]
MFAHLHPKYVFGLSATCKSNNVWFTDNNTIMYPAGNAVVMLNLDQKSQTFLHGVEKQKSTTCLAVSHNRYNLNFLGNLSIIYITIFSMYAALGHTGDGEGSIAVFDLKSNKRAKTLVSTDYKVTEYVSLCFTADNLHVIGLTAAPDFTCVLWKWDRSRVVAMVKATGGLGPVYEVSTSPMDSNLICTAGKDCFKFYRFNENHLKQFGFQRADEIHFLSCAWYKSDKMIAGTADGKLMLFERGEYRHDIAIKNVKNEITGALAEKARLRQKDETMRKSNAAIETLGGGPPPPASQTDVTMIHVASSVQQLQVDQDVDRPTSKFMGDEITSIATYSKGFAAAYGVGNVVIFEEQLVYTGPDDHYKQMYLIRIPHSTSESEDRIIKTLAISPNEELLLASTYNCNIYSFQLSSVEIKEPDEMVFEFANCSYHFGPILSLDVAIRKSLLVTCGADKFIRVWNFLAMTQEAQAEFAEEIYCVTIHPMGLFVLAGMVDKIRMYTILMNDIRELREWPVRSCRELKFSNGGHYFAAANGNILQLYSTTTLENVANMKGHSNKIRKIYWTLDDNKVITAGGDGAIYEWDVQTGKRTADLVKRESKLASVVATPDAKIYFAINSTHIKEIQIQEGTILQEIELGLTPTCLALSRSGKILLAAFDNGTIRAFKQPLTYSNEWTDYHLHSASVNGLLCTYDEIYCISVSSDNTIIFWKMTDADGRVAKLEKDLCYATEVLVTKNDLEERQVAINELKQKYAELKIEMDYALKRKDITYQEEIRDVNNKFVADIDQLKTRIEELEKLKDKNADEYNAYLLEVKKHHQSSLSNMEAHFNTKLISEFEKYNALQNLLEETIKEYEGRLVTLEEDKGKAIEELVDYFDSKIKDKNGALEQAFNEARVQMSESEEMKRQIEEDADQEILEMTTSYERKLGHEREMNAKLKEKAGMMTNKFQTMQKEIEERMNEVQRLHSECSKLVNTIKSTEREVVQLQKQLVDSGVSNVQKEKTIAELQKSNSDLDKFKFVLEHKIKELKKNIEPKEREIVYLKQQNTDMENELDATIAVRSGLQLQVSELQNKLKMTDHEYNTEKRMRVRLQVLLERIRGHMTRCMSVLQDHKHLKYTVKENMMLVYEINNLRAELKRTRDKVASYETALGFNASHATEAAEMRLKLQHAIEDRDEIDIQHDNVVEVR